MSINGNAQAGVGGAGRKGIPTQNQNSAISSEQQAAGISNAMFLATIFGQDDFCWVTKFRDSPTNASSGCWVGRLCLPGEVADFPDLNGYFSVAAFGPDAKARNYANFIQLNILVLDDPQGCPLAPSWVLRTSPDKFQIGFRLAKPVTDIEVAKRLHQELAKNGNIPVDPSGNNPVRYVRLPVGVNTKLDPPFPCVLETFQPELFYDLDELIEGLGLNAARIYGQKVPPKAALGAGDAIIEGQRNSTLTSYAGSMRRRGMSQEAIEAALLAENASRCYPPLQDNEVIGIARSVAKYAPADATPSLSSAEFHFDVRPLTLDILHAVYPPREFAIEPLLPRGVLIELSGAHGISKSTLALDMVLCCACERQWCGLPTAGGKAVFASREDAYDEIVRRVQGWLEGIPLAERAAVEKALCQNLILLGREETERLGVTTKEFGKCSVQREAIDLIVERCQGAVLIVLETASRLHGGDELNEDLAQLAEGFEQIASRTGAAVMLIRHVSKEAARSKSTDSYTGRGGGALSDAARSVLVLVQLTPKEARDRQIALDGLATAIHSPVIVLTHAKANYSQCHDSLYFVRLPGPRLQQVKPPDALDTFGERLLQFIKREALLGKPLSTRQLKRRSSEFNISQANVEGVLEHLRKAGRIAPMETKAKGGTYDVWVLLQ